MIDQVKIGGFIAKKRKEQGLTQAQLAEILCITDRAVSKWENGKCLPDSSVMLLLCQTLKISVNELLCGEETEMNEIDRKNEELLIELAAQKEKSDKQLLALEIVIGVLSVIIMLGFTATAAYLQMETYLRVIFIVLAFALSLPGLFFALRIEQTAGYYQCNCCGHRYVPTFRSVLFAMHLGRTRFMKCPKCKKHSWQTKVIKR